MPGKARNDKRVGNLEKDLGLPPGDPTQFDDAVSKKCGFFELEVPGGFAHL